jgi:hypothetical protein
MPDDNVVLMFQAQSEALAAEERVLKSGGPGGTSGGMDVIDSKIAAAEARTDTKFAELRGDLAKFATKGTVWGAVGTAVALLLAVAAFGGDRFDAGMSSSSAVASYSEAQRRRDAIQDEKLNQILQRLPKATPATKQ